LDLKSAGLYTRSVVKRGTIALMQKRTNLFVLKRKKESAPDPQVGA